MLTYVIDSMFDLVQLLKHFDLVMTGGRVCVACSDKLGVKQTEAQVLVQHVSPESPGKHVFIELDNNPGRYSWKMFSVAVCSICFIILILTWVQLLLVTLACSSPQFYVAF